MAKLPRWDLSAYYSGLKDPKIQKDLTKALEEAAKFAGKYRGKITETVGPRLVLSALRDAEKIYLTASKPVIFAQLVFTTETKNPEAGALVQKISKDYTNVRNLMLFMDLNITQLSQKKLS